MTENKATNEASETLDYILIFDLQLTPYQYPPVTAALVPPNPVDRRVHEAFEYFAVIGNQQMRQQVFSLTLSCCCSALVSMYC